MNDSDQRSGRSRQSGSGRRHFMQSAGVLGLGLTAGASAAISEETVASTDEEGVDATTSDDGDPTGIDSPTLIDEPGAYELVSDLSPDELERPYCIGIASDDVTLDGNGHTIDLRGTDYTGEGPRQRANCIDINTEGIHEDGDGVYWETDVEDVTVMGGASGIATSFWAGGAFTEITARENGYGLLFGIDTGTVRNCVVSDNNTGVYLGGGDTMGGSLVEMEHCSVRENLGPGVHLGTRSELRATSSTFVLNGVGVRGTGWDGSGRLRECHICRNETYGLEGRGTHGYRDEDSWEPDTVDRFDAVDNYWGAADGPSSFGNPEEPFTDPETGRPADGDGDAISQSLEPGVSNVRFDPFLESPLEDVGADR